MTLFQPHFIIACTAKILYIKNWKKYFQKRTCAASVSISTFIYLYQMYEYGNWEKGRAFWFLGIHNSNLLCSVHEHWRDCLMIWTLLRTCLIHYSVFRMMILKCQAALLLKKNISKVFACFYKMTFSISRSSGRGPLTCTVLHANKSTKWT